MSLLKFVVVGRFGWDARTEKPVVEGQRRAWEQPRPDTAGEQTDVTRDLPRVLADAVCALAAATEAANNAAAVGHEASAEVKEEAQQTGDAAQAAADAARAKMDDSTNPKK